MDRLMNRWKDGGEDAWAGIDVDEYSNKMSKENGGES